MGASSPLYPPSVAASALKAVKETRKPDIPKVIDVGDCPSREDGEFWDWMGKCVDADGRDITPGVFSSSTSGLQPVITVSRPARNFGPIAVPSKLGRAPEYKPGLFERMKKAITWTLFGNND